jgi:hypothetical protein
MSAADLAASVHPCTAIPTFAFFKAGASFTPSPNPQFCVTLAARNLIKL